MKIDLMVGTDGLVALTAKMVLAAGRRWRPRNYRDY
jgi:hypothetical protein